MGNEINSKFQKERAIKETLMDSKIAAMEQCLDEKIGQLIQKQLSNLGISSTKPATHGPGSSSTPTTGSTIPATKNNTPPIQLDNRNDPTSSNSNATVPRFLIFHEPVSNHPRANVSIVLLHRLKILNHYKIGEYDGIGREKTEFQE
ncbi:hypothetical protein FXO38_28170 [Capsicum annuum]|nr:hypothetical protein FXO37_35246 [Capsicum annuum]KAF3628562.1 hypothetical protein FXO38_28170 [Capsicum annuum]